MQTSYNDDMKGITTDNSYFLHFREDDDILYVDKTMYAYRLIRERGNFFFLSRPRRFGKSLFCSMLHFLFEGRKEFFKGLYIAEKTDYGFESYPVIHFDFSGMTLFSAESFIRNFKTYIRMEAERNGIELKDGDPSEMLEELIVRLSDAKGKIVIIIDEFDSPFTGAMDNPELLERIRAAFNPFYATMKKHAGRIRLLFITGVLRLSNLSIFSAMNNLVDISMSPEYAAAFGYTERELEENFGEGIDEYLEGNPGKYESREEFIGRIRAYYDGYRFSPDSEVTVYNPVSIGYFFREDCRFRDYWNRTGVPTLAVNLAKQYDLSSYSEGKYTVGPLAFVTFDISDITGNRLTNDGIAALLYFAGYLTIADSDEFATYLTFPNREIASSFSLNLLSRCTDDRNFFSPWFSQFIKAARSGDEETLRKKLVDFFTAFSYEVIGKEKEKFYQMAFHSIFLIAGIYAISEDRGARGRADEVLLTGDHIWVFELKMDKSADDALKQIEEKGYAEKYAYLMKPGMRIHKIGISFSSETRQIIEWKSQSDCL